ncbi:toll-like receptor 13 [Protopterus annectens]|uniref:toll-like receptor 13 n=1 Tax=Protopterus annectens TaxID=7888 RepID=UPI001CF9DE08|nr:toll-like receptor 13 [Protopterus annectens]
MTKFHFAITFFFILNFSFASGWLAKHCEIFDNFLMRGIDFYNGKHLFPEDYTFAVCGITPSYGELREVSTQLDGLCSFIQTVKPRTFSQFINLKMLFLDAPGQCIIYPGAFQGLKNLEYLEFSLNFSKHSIPVLYKGAFDGLSKVRILKISGYNFLPSSSPLILSPLTKLESLQFESTFTKDLCDIICKIQNLTLLKQLAVTLSGTEIIKLNCSESLQTGHEIQLCKVQSNITNLDLTFNPLYNIEPGSLYFCQNLEFLNVSLSDVNISELLQSGIRTVTTLHMTSMQKRTKDFLKHACNLSLYFKVRNLILSGNNIDEISNRSVAKCQLLESLNLGDNVIKKTENNILCLMTNLKIFSLANNNLETINICPSDQGFTSPMTNLDLSANAVRALKSKQFSCMVNLKSLNLEKNAITVIHESAFYGLKSLTELSLKKNRLSQIQDHYFMHLETLTSLNLLGNVIHETQLDTFKKLFLLRELYLGTFQKMSSIVYLSLLPSGLKILFLESENDISLYNISGKQTHFLETLHIKCDALSVHRAEPLMALKTLHIDAREIYNFKGSSYFMNSTNLEEICFKHLGDRSLTKQLLPDLSKLNHLKYLQLEETYFSSSSQYADSENVFQKLTSLEVLVLINSEFTSFTPQMFNDLVSLKLLVVAMQNIILLSPDLFQSSLTLKYVYFYKVIFQCDCQNSWIILWAATKRDMILIMEREKCITKYLTSPFVSFLEMTCDLPLEYSFFVGTSVSITLFMIFVLLYEMAGWYIVYILYIIKAWLAGLLGERRMKAQYKYDVFVSYSSKDEFWVVNELIPNLEQKGPPFLKVCLHNRDFEVGKDIVDNIVDSIYSSRKTICVITHHYLWSEWCSLEMRMVTYRLLAESQDLLILVFLERISLHEISAFHRLARLIKKKTYIDWPDGEHEQLLFWEKLKGTLKKDIKEETEQRI